MIEIAIWNWRTLMVAQAFSATTESKSSYLQPGKSWLESKRDLVCKPRQLSGLSILARAVDGEQDARQRPVGVADDEANVVPLRGEAGRRDVFHGAHEVGDVHVLQAVYRDTT